MIIICHESAKEADAGLGHGLQSRYFYKNARQVDRQERAMSEARIEINPKVMLGKPVIRGTRITVELILRKLAEGATRSDLLEAYPHLSEDDIQAAITYAADTLAHEENVLVESKA